MHTELFGQYGSLLLTIWRYPADYLLDNHVRKVSREEPCECDHVKSCIMTYSRDCGMVLYP